MQQMRLMPTEILPNLTKFCGFANRRARGAPIAAGIQDRPAGEPPANMWANFV
jgi:hypothetical protein